MAADRDVVRVGGWMGIVGPSAYIATWTVLGVVQQNYDPVRQAISELGAVGAATRPWMSAAFVVFGLAALPFARALHRGLPGDSRLTAVVAGVAGIMTVGAAVFPCTAGCPGTDGAATDVGHAVVATLGYAALLATPLLTGRLLLAEGRWAGFAWWSIAAGAVSTGLLVLWALGGFGSAGGAGQRIFNTVADLWWISAGVLLVRQAPGSAGGFPAGKSD